MNPNFHTRFFAPEDRDSLEALYQAIYGKNWQQKTSLAWTVDRPTAAAGALLAVEDKNRVVAAQPYRDLPLHTEMGSGRATLFLDVATHPEYQRRGLFKRVVSAATAAAFERGSSIIMTTPNRIAFGAFQKISGWRQLCSLDCMVLPLGAGDPVQSGKFISLVARSGLAVASRLRKEPIPLKPLSGQMNGRHIEAPWLPSSDADTLWQRFAPRVGHTIERSRDFLRWRFNTGYRLFLARDFEGPLGYIATRIIDRGGVRIGVIVDYVSPIDDVSAFSLLSHVIAWLREQGASAAISYFFRKSIPWKQLRAAGFVRLARICTPREYPICVNVRPGESYSAKLLDPSRWHLSLADSDLV